MEPTPCSDWMAWKPVATVAIASSHETFRHSSSIVSRTMGESWRSRWAAYP